jgi:AcrR family transcriptional regulator
MKAAMSEFARLGFEDASTRGIAEAAGAPHSLVIYHFPSKEALWYQTVEDAVQRYSRSALAPTASGPVDRSAAGRLRRILARYIRFSSENPDFFRMMTHENTIGSERLNWHIETNVRPMIGRTATLVTEAQQQGEFVAGDPINLVYVFLGCATGPYRSSREIEALTGKSPFSPEAVEAHIAACERLFFTKDHRAR